MKLKTIIAICFFSFFLTAPNSKASDHTLSIELLGAGGLYSIGYSYRLSQSLAANLNGSYYSLSGRSEDTSLNVTFMLFPTYLSYLLGGSRHFFEILGGANILYASASVTSGALRGSASGFGVYPLAGLGFRYWPNGSGFHFRATAYTMYINKSFGFIPGVSFGFAF